MPDLSTREKLVFLTENLGRTLTALLAGIRDRGNIEKWVENALTPDPAWERRVAFTYGLFERIRAIRGDEDNLGCNITRAWLIGNSVGDTFDPPVIAIREDRFSEVEASLERLLREDYFGEYEDETAQLIERLFGIVLL